MLQLEMEWQQDKCKNSMPFKRQNLLMKWDFSMHFKDNSSMIVDEEWFLHLENISVVLAATEWLRQESNAMMEM